MSCVQNRSSKLSARLLRRFAIPFILTAMLLSVCVYAYTGSSLRSYFREELTESAKIMSAHYIREVSSAEYAYDDPRLLHDLCAASDMAVMLIKEDGSTVQSGGFTIMDGGPWKTTGEPVLFGQPDGLRLMACASELTVDGINVTMVAALKVNWIMVYLNRLFWILVIINAFGIIIAFFIGHLTVISMLEPVKTMIRRAHEIDENALNTRLSVPETDDELRQLALTMNAMLDRVENAYERQKQFTQNASHELRTPLAVMQGNTDILLRWGSENPETVRKCTGAISRQLDYMNKLVTNLLFLTRGDSRSHEIHREPVTYMALAEIMEDQRETDPDHCYTLAADSGLSFSADAAMVRQLLFILLDNAARFTKPGCGIRLEAVKTAERTRVSVTDEGCGVSDDQLEKIFERFYRVDKARSRATGGTGLGLSIARTIAELHGGTIHAEHNTPSGLRVVFDLPDLQ